MVWAQPFAVVSRSGGEVAAADGWESAPDMADHSIAGFAAPKIRKLRRGDDLDSGWAEVIALKARVEFLEDTLRTIQGTALRRWVSPFPSPRPTVRDHFKRLAETWRTETTDSDSLGRNMFTHPAYLQIIGMGPEVVPLILAELAREPDHWGLALSSITGENPVRREDAGDIEAIAGAWLRWAKDKGIRFAEAELY